VHSERDDSGVPARHVEFYRRKGRMEKFVTDVFKPFCLAGETIPVDHEVSSNFGPVKDWQQDVDFELYASTKTDVKYTDDPSAQRIGVIKVKLPTRNRFDELVPNCGLDRSVDVTFKFGGTEIVVEAKELTTGQVVYTKIVCGDLTFSQPQMASTF
jgi:hypothetical protein